MSSNIQPLACGGTANTGITHITNSTKSLIQAIWTPSPTVSTERTVIK